MKTGYKKVFLAVVLLLFFGTGCSALPQGDYREVKITAINDNATMGGSIKFDLNAEIQGALPVTVTVAIKDLNNSQIGAARTFQITSLGKTTLQDQGITIQEGTAPDTYRLVASIPPATGETVTNNNEDVAWITVLREKQNVSIDEMPLVLALVLGVFIVAIIRKKG